MHDAFDSILPVATLLLGAGLANFLKLSELRRNLRLDAADQLAELPPFLWNKTDSDAWLKMNAAVRAISSITTWDGTHEQTTQSVDLG